MRKDRPRSQLSAAAPSGGGRATSGGRRPRGFTLAEVALTLVIVGTGILSVVQLMAVCTTQNRVASDATTAMYLANNVQEAIAHLPFSDPSGAPTFGLEETGAPASTWNDVDDFNNFVASPPIDATRQPIADLAGFRQEVTVQRVDPQRLTLAAAGTDAARVTVRVFRVNRDGTHTELHTLTWVRMRG